MVMVLNCRSLPPFCASVESNMRGSAKICSPPMVEVMTTKMTVGRMLGTVTEVNCRNRLAPSIAAASYRSRGTACMAASRIRAL